MLLIEHRVPLSLKALYWLQMDFFSEVSIIWPIFVELDMIDLESMKAVICLHFFQVQKEKSNPSASETIFLPTVSSLLPS